MTAGTDAADFPAVDAVDTLRARVGATPDRVLVLVAGGLTNGPEIADAWGVAALDEVRSELTCRVIEHAGIDAHVLHAFSFGGFLAAVVVDQDLVTTQVAALVDAVRGLVPVADTTIWPVVSVGVRPLASTDDSREALRDVRALAAAAGREAPGATRWHSDRAFAAHPEDLSLARDLAIAVAGDTDQIRLAYQPIWDLHDHGTDSAEALLRWHHPTLGAISPMLAVQVAERTGLIVPLGRLVVDRALAQLAAWRAHHAPDFRVHVNVSALELREATYVDHLEAALDRHGVPASALLLEITETAVLTEEPAVRATLRALQDLGVGLGIDDFGAGYSTIAHVQRMDFDTIKLDRSLIADIATSATSFSLARTVLAMVSAPGVRIVAEGIEDAVTAAHLRALGCRLGQGYHLGRPAPAEDLFGPTPVRRPVTARASGTAAVTAIRSA